MYKILLCGLKHETNIGDPVIMESTRYLVETILNQKDYEIEDIDIAGRESFHTLLPTKCNPINRLIRKFFYYGFYGFGRILKKTIFGSHLENISWKFSDTHLVYLQQYEQKIKDADLVIFSGGGIIKYKYQDFYQYIDFMTQVADKYNTSVYFNAVGIEGYNEKDPKCKRLKNALNRKSVKIITTRDDIELLDSKYIINSDIKTARVADPAVVSNVAMHIEKQKDTHTIGLGLVRPKIFLDQGLSFDENDLLQFYVDVIKELDNRKLSYQLFNNGFEKDYEFGDKVLEAAGKVQEKSKLLLPRPMSAEELLTTVSHFEGVISCRLHACIVSYALNVPAIGIVWNDKVKMFGENIGYGDRFFRIGELDVIKIVDKLELAIKEGYSQKERASYIKSASSILEQFLLSEVK